MSEQEQLPIVAEQETAPAASPFANVDTFENGQRMARLFAASDLVPKEYRDSVPNIMLAFEIAHRTGASPFFVMQNIHMIQRRPSYSAQFVIAVLNSCGRFRGGLKFEMDDPKSPRTCRAWAIEAATGDRIDGPLVSMEMAEREGWLEKPGSKWKTMPEVMLRYRAASFFGRLYAPDILLGMYSADEAREMAENATSGRLTAINEALSA